jgi:hypothetical protein
LSFRFSQLVGESQVLPGEVGSSICPFNLRGGPQKRDRLWARGLPDPFWQMKKLRWHGEDFIRTFLERDITTGIYPSETIRRFWTIVHTITPSLNAAEFARSMGTAEKTAAGILISCGRLR